MEMTYTVSWQSVWHCPVTMPQAKLSLTVDMICIFKNWEISIERICKWQVLVRLLCTFDMAMYVHCVQFVYTPHLCILFSYTFYSWF